MASDLPVTATPGLGQLPAAFFFFMCSEDEAHVFSLPNEHFNI